MKGRPVEKGVEPIGKCATCGKLSFLTRKAAKRWARRHRPGEHFNEYKCGDYWHYGHVFAATLRGERSRHEVAARRRRDQGDDS